MRLRILALLTVLASLACGGGADTAATVPVLPVADVVEPAAAPSELVDPSGRVKLGQREQDAIAAGRARFASVQNVEAFDEAWREALKLAEVLEPPLQTAYDARDMEALELDWMLPHTPGLTVDYVAEGTAVQVVLDAAAWKEKAAATSDPDDDRLMALIERVYGSASPSGWAAWEERTWDLGGCAALGRDVIIEVLLEADALRTGRFAGDVAPIRESALNAVLEDNEQFPYCDPSTSEPTPPEQLQAEVRRILAEVHLTDTERASVEARLAHFGG